MAIGLRRAGHQVTVATHENFASFVRQFDLKFAPIACSIEVAGIATSIALNISVLCILGDTNENSLRCTVLDFHFWKQCPFYSYSSLY
ncbi:hypothetical protein [Nostoc flagelliforme]|uniref:hypothetical protein n=1 Tax=Nostoc flagelliforme TaxID=1306274 RepID=UPI0021F0C610|nr:hypothetical protein [Nostoc flagelliforme]